MGVVYGKKRAMLAGVCWTASTVVALEALLHIVKLCCVDSEKPHCCRDAEYRSTIPLGRLLGFRDPSAFSETLSVSTYVPLRKSLLLKHSQDDRFF